MEITLEEMLEARERRAQRQRELLGEARGALICFTMNIAGPEKQSALIRRGFERGCALLDGQLEGSGLTVLRRELLHERTGSEGCWLVDAEAETLKRLCVELEDEYPAGRLFDLDVLDRAGRHLERTALGFPERKCLLCGSPAKECARSRTHSVEELRAETERLLRETGDRETAEEIASLACRSLLHEVCTTPKPGLVDRNNSGSHRDMDMLTFMDSAAALWPYFQRCARLGVDAAEDPAEETFSRLRWLGKQAERAMLGATGGVNTHKGAIFSMGLLCAAAGRLEREDWRRPEAVLRECADMTRGLCERDFRGVTPENARTAGERLYALHGEAGVRGEAERGFPAVRDYGLPTLEKGLEKGLSFNDAGCAALLAMLAHTVDSNLFARSGREGAKQAAGMAQKLLEAAPFPKREALEWLDGVFIEKNLSPGGSADLLAITYFLHFLCFAA